MSEFHVNVVKLTNVREHPNADTLNIANVFGYQVITKKGCFQEGELVVYIPIDSIVPDTEEWHFMCSWDKETNQPKYPVGSVPEKYRIVEAKKLRGIFSQGMLAPLPKTSEPLIEGSDVQDLLGITKYEPVEHCVISGDAEAPPRGWIFPKYTDVEGMKRNPDIIQELEYVVLTEKIHGVNARYVHDGKRLWVGSHTQIKKYDEKNIFWKQAIKDDLETKLSYMPMHIFFGEIYGQVQDLKYNIKSGSDFRVFDVYSLAEQKYLNFDEAYDRADSLGLKWVPILYEGPWTAKLNELAEGQSSFANNVREGFVVKPQIERWNEKVGRVILKRHGEGYLLRKKK